VNFYVSSFYEEEKKFPVLKREDPSCYHHIDRPSSFSQYLESMIADLAPWEEAVGRLEAVEEDRGALVLSLRCLIKIRIPSGADLEEELRRIMGRKVGLLRTDSGVLFRVLDGNDDKLRVSSARGPPDGEEGG
jgi:hypothetical protein